MAEELRLNIVSTADSKGFDKAAKDVAEAKAEAKGLSDTWEKASGNAERLEQSTDDATKSVRSHSEQVRLLRAEYEKTTKRISELDSQLLGGGDTKGIRKDLREQRAWLAEVQRVAKELQRSSGTKFSLTGGDGPNAPKLDFSGMGGMGRGGLIGGVVGLVALAAPAIGAVVAGAVVGGVATGGVVGGVIAAAQDPRVKKAWEDMTAGISFKTFGGDQLAGPVSGAIGVLGGGLKGLNLDQVLGKAGPGIENLARGVVDLATNAMPGFIAVMDNLDEITEVIADGMGNVGDAFSDMLIDMLESEGTLEGLQAIFDVLSGTLRATGEVTKFLGGAFHMAGRTSAEFSGAMEDVFMWLQLITPVAIPVQKLMASINDTTENLTGGTGDVSMQMEYMTTSSAHLNERLHELGGGFSAVEVEAMDATAALKDFYAAQLGQLDANIAYEQSLDDLAAGFKEHGRDMNIDAQNGRDNMKNFESAIGDAIAARDKLASQGKIEEANAAYKRMVDRIRDVMIQAGFTQKAIDELIKPYTLTITANFVVRNKPNFIASNYSQGAQDAMRAEGGPVTAGKSYIVGEKRAELFVPNQNGMILPSVPSAYGGMGGGDARPAVFNFPAGSYEQALIETISTAVQARGGRLAVLGLKAA